MIIFQFKCVRIWKCIHANKLTDFCAYVKMKIKPLVEPTKQIMKIGMSEYDWHELFPKGKT